MRECGSEGGEGGVGNMVRPLSNSVYPAHSERNMNEVLMHVYGDTLKTKRQGREHTTTNNKKQCNETDNLLPSLPVSDSPTQRERGTKIMSQKVGRM